MPFPAILKSYGEAMMRLIYPAFCGVCRLSLALEERHLCASCTGLLESAQLPVDRRPLDLSFQSITQGWALYPYESPVREILTAVKFQQKRWLLRLFENDFAETAALLASETRYDAVIPVPLERGRLLQREFNQSEILAAFAAKGCHLPVRKFLRRRFATAAQSGLGREDRRLNILFAFQPSPRADLRGKTFLIVDDVLTTGATADEAARILLEEGAAQVDVLTLAYTPEPRETVPPAKNFTQTPALWDTTAS